MITRELFRQLPNGITSVRVIVAASFPFCPESLHLPLIMVALVTEFLDGFIARLFSWTSYFGQVFDPVADKLFVLSVSLTWVNMGKVTILQWLLLALRDFGVLFIVAALFLTKKLHSVKSIQARLLSKLTTGLQYLIFLLVIMDCPELLLPVAIVTGLTGLLAVLQYIYLLGRASD